MKVIAWLIAAWVFAPGALLVVPTLWRERRRVQALPLATWKEKP